MHVTGANPKVCDKERAMTFLEAALQTPREGGPLHHREIAEKAGSQLLRLWAGP